MTDYEIPDEVRSAGSEAYHDAFRAGRDWGQCYAASLDAIVVGLVEHGWAPPAVEPQPAPPRPHLIETRVWRVTGKPGEDWPDDSLGVLYREREGHWEQRADSGQWVASGWRGLKHMQGVGFVLAEVGQTQDGDA